jgi:HNH endonuclease
MKERYRLEKLGNDELLAALSGLVRRGNELTCDLLAHLGEIDQRGLHLDLGFASLFAYCTEALGFCESAAGRRIAAARVCRRFPEALGLVAHGELHLYPFGYHEARSALCALNSYLNRQNVAELFKMCSRKSRRQVEEVLAARFPKPDVRAQIRRLPGQVMALAVDRYGFHFTGSAQLKEKIERAQALASHQLPSGDLAALVDLALDALLRDLEQRRFAVGRRSRRRTTSERTSAPADGEARVSVDAHSESSPPPGGCSKRTRYVPAAVAREVYLRDLGCCSFVSKEGRRCGSRAFLELDHMVPWADGGDSTPENLRLRCRAHNQQHARDHFGHPYIAARVARRRSERSLPQPREELNRQDSERRRRLA